MHSASQPPPSQAALRDALILATQTAVTELQSTGEHFYYLTLITTGEALSPVLCAWSTEALQRAAGDVITPEALLDLKWSYADAPYFDVCKEAFEPVRRLFGARPAMVASMSEAEWMQEHALRLGAMEDALRAVDAAGLFGSDAARDDIVINVEIMPPDGTNRARAKRLNPVVALRAWLMETAEAASE